jgi:antitoxin CptB
MTGSDSRRYEKLRWRSRRGLLELELLLAPFVESRMPTLGVDLLDQFEALLEFDDVDVHEWLLGRSEAPREVADVVAEIRRTSAGQ